MDGPKAIGIAGTTLESARCRLSGPGGNVHLEPRVVDLALILADRTGEVVSRDTLVQSVWAGYPGGDQALSSAVSKLRRAVRSAGGDPADIQTVPKRGYRLRATRDPAGGPDANRPRAIAVLPLRSLDDHEQQPHLCEGLAEDLLDALGRVPGLRVAARTSSFALARTNASLPEIGARLQVDCVLEGSLRQVGNRYRVRVSLAAVNDQSQLWSRAFDCQEDQLPNLPAIILRGLLAEAPVQLGSPRAPVLHREDLHPDAYDAFLRGRYLWYRENTNPGRALEQFHRAIELAPDFAAPYAGLVDCYCTYGLWQLMDQSEARARALSYAEQALALAPESADVQFSHSYAQAYARWRWDSSERALRRALEINPDHLLATSFLGALMALLGRSDEASQLADRLTALDPLSAWAWTFRGVIYHGLRRFDVAADVAAEALVLEPNDPLPLWVAGSSLAQLGRAREANRLARRIEACAHHLDFPLGLAASIHAVCGHRKEAEGILAELLHRRQERAVSPFVLGHVHAALGQEQRAIQYLQAAFEERNMAMWWIAYWAGMESLRDHPAFMAILRELGLE